MFAEYSKQIYAGKGGGDSGVLTWLPVRVSCLFLPRRCVQAELRGSKQALADMEAQLMVR